MLHFEYLLLTIFDLHNPIFCYVHWINQSNEFLFSNISYFSSRMCIWFFPENYNSLLKLFIFSFILSIFYSAFLNTFRIVFRSPWLLTSTPWSSVGVLLLYTFIFPIHRTFFLPLQIPCDFFLNCMLDVVQNVDWNQYYFFPEKNTQFLLGK